MSTRYANAKIPEYINLIEDKDEETKEQEIVILVIDDSEADNSETIKTIQHQKTIGTEYLRTCE